MPPERAESPVDLQALLVDGLRALGLELDPATVSGLLAYQALIQKWNRVYNLTAIREPRQMLVQHLLDSLAIVPPLRQRFGEIPAPLAIDVGSGAGLPGIPLALAWPQLHVTTVEPVGKKAAFIQHAIGELGLRNAASAACRIEQLKQSPALRSAAGNRPSPLSGREPDLIVSRAFASLADFATSIESVAGTSTRVAAMKGVLPLSEINDLPAGWVVDESIPLTVPGLDAQRHLILFSRSA